MNSKKSNFPLYRKLFGHTNHQPLLNEYHLETDDDFYDQKVKDCICLLYIVKFLNLENFGSNFQQLIIKVSSSMVF